MKRAYLVSSFFLALTAASASASAQTPPVADGQGDVPAGASPDETAPRARLKRSSVAGTPDVAAPDAVTIAPVEPGPTPAPYRSTDRVASEGPPRYDLIRVNMGVRIGYLPNRAFDTFASNDVLPQFSIDGTYPLLTRGNLVLGAGLGWDVGGRSDTVRRFESSVTAHRLYVPLEGRWHFTPGLYAFGKVSPGAAAVIVSVQDPSSPNELSTTGWAFSADASIGASILLGPRAHMDKRGPRIWVTPEIGYAYTTNAPLNVNPGREDKDLLGSDENTNLRALALSGLFWRASVGMTF